MKKFTFLLIILLAAVHSNGDDKGLKFDLIVPSLTWKTPQAPAATPILIIWKITNETDRGIILPIGSESLLYLVDSRGTVIKFDEIGNAPIPYTYTDYIRLPPHWGRYIVAGNYNLSFQNNKIYISGLTQHNHLIKFGPIQPGKYKLNCIFSTRADPSPHAKRVFNKKDLWLGEHESDPFQVEIE